MFNPIVSPTVTGVISSNSRRITGLERNIRARPSTRSQRATVSFIGKQPTDSGESEFDLVSARFFVPGDFLCEQIWIDVDVPINVPIRLAMMVDDTEVLRFSIPAQAEFILHRIQNEILVPSTKSIRIEGLDAYPDSSGFVTIQIMGFSSAFISQTVGLRFTEPD